MASADPQRQQHAQGRRRASFILRGRPRGPRVPGGRTVRGAPAAGPDPRPSPGAERASPRASRARVRAGNVWGACTPLQGRLFKFSEVGSAPSKGAWGFVINPRQSGAQEAAVATEREFELCREVPQAACPESQTLFWVPAHTLFRTFPIKPSPGPQTLVEPATPCLAISPGKVVSSPQHCSLLGSTVPIFQRWKLRLKRVKPEKYKLLVKGSLDQTTAHPGFPSITFPFHLQPLPCQLCLQGEEYLGMREALNLSEKLSLESQIMKHPIWKGAGEDVILCHLLQTKRLSPRSHMSPWLAYPQVSSHCAAGCPQHCILPKEHLKSILCLTSQVKDLFLILPKTS